MPTGFKQDYNFIREDFSMSASWGKQTVQETRLVECYNVTDTGFDLQDTLPAYGTPGQPITYTVGLSPHPHRPNLILKEISEVTRSSEDRGGPFWNIRLEYATPDFMSGGSPGETKKQKRRDQRIDQNNRVIVYPWNEPAIWSSGSREAMVDRWEDPDGNTLRHTNGLPLEEPIKVPLNTNSHSFTFNIAFEDFDYDRDFEPYMGRINTVQLKPQFGQDAEVHCVKLDAMSFSEHYDTVDYQVPDNQSEQGGYRTYYEDIHYITVNVTFIVDPSGFDIKYISRHTMQFVEGWGLAPIAINSRGDYATSPWPLKPNGEAVPFTTLQDVDWTEDAGEVGYISTNYPLRTNLAVFCNKWGLRIPKP